jgi:membrane-anchored protein YejM (alkaline phosphatase superfamily)
MMPRLDAWANRGLRFENHYSAANNSHPGLFGLFYGRSPLLYHQTLDAHIIPQLCRVMKNSGYRSTYLATNPIEWERMEDYLNQRSFDEVIVETKDAWWRRDIKAVNHARRLLKQHAGTPQFIFLFTMSTHFEYEYPPEYELYKPVATTDQMHAGNRQEYRPQVLNRYMNACRFSDDQLADFIQELDPKKNLIILTGDHGESFFEDGFMVHGSRLSDIQMRVPFAIVGPGVEPGVVTRLTSHIDFLPTFLHLMTGRHVAVPHSQGRDLLEPVEGPDQVMVWQMESMRRPYMLGALVQPQGRMMFKAFVEKDEPRISILGVCDESGQLDTLNPLPAEQMPRWQHSFEWLLYQMAGQGRPPGEGTGAAQPAP